MVTKRCTLLVVFTLIAVSALRLLSAAFCAAHTPRWSIRLWRPCRWGTILPPNVHFCDGAKRRFISSTEPKNVFCMNVCIVYIQISGHFEVTCSISRVSLRAVHACNNQNLLLAALTFLEGHSCLDLSGRLRRPKWSAHVHALFGHSYHTWKVCVIARVWIRLKIIVWNAEIQGVWNPGGLQDFSAEYILCLMKAGLRRSCLS